MKLFHFWLFNDAYGCKSIGGCDCNGSLMMGVLIPLISNAFLANMAFCRASCFESGDSNSALLSSPQLAIVEMIEICVVLVHEPLKMIVYDSISYVDDDQIWHCRNQNSKSIDYNTSQPLITLMALTMAFQ
ncbi:hypothetical protein DERP_008905 [Dermatophagoides pteronyssinus]|uniref:Uncharacterized protein n=1 Tax=Dermatophagoides pteronyssinus TaxID=6956 RepID=A0ABQ8JN67_DERPT|nr:hypothetical protein DERP_008905 [Dermatophagoides pteronyssinus]